MKSIFLLLGCAVILTGCVSDGDNGKVNQSIEHNESQALQQERLNRLSDQVEVLLQRADNQDRELASIKARLEQLQAAGGGASAAQLAQLQKMLADVDKARQADRQIILDEVAKQLDALAKRSGTPTPKQTTNPAPAEQGYEHIVKAGETISAIAHAYGVTADAILKANNIKDATKIQIGQKLFIPKK